MRTRSGASKPCANLAGYNSDGAIDRFDGSDFLSFLLFFACRNLVQRCRYYEDQKPVQVTLKPDRGRVKRERPAPTF